MRDTFWKMRPNKSKALMLAKKLLPEFVCDAVNLEGNNNFKIGNMNREELRRCFVSFAVFYGKVERNFRAFTKEQGIKFYEPTNEQKIELANQLSDIAFQYGMRIYTCFSDYLIGDKIKKAHCLDGDLISQLFY